MSTDGITDSLRQMQVGDKIILGGIERPNIHSLAKRALRAVKVNKRPNGSFLVTCTGVLADKGEVEMPTFKGEVYSDGI